ncbi:MAG: hypothetical protein LBU68_01180 [Rickettsiales bacterium]|jgi:hypothetical protein|nr:hypothetical protein [Rickettsiales bacterium]
MKKFTSVLVFVLMLMFVRDAFAIGQNATFDDILNGDFEGSEVVEEVADEESIDYEYTDDKQYDRPRQRHLRGIDVGDKPAIVCRSHSCTRLSERITESFLFNSLVAMFYNSQKTRVSICEADPVTRSCTHQGIRFGAEVGGTPVVMQMPTYTLSDVQIGRKLKHLGFAMSYDVYANGLKSNCNTAKNMIEIRDTNMILITGDTFLCQLTSDIPSQIFTMYNMDYIDLDYNLMGGYYSFGMSGSAKGQKKGYMIMKFDDITGGAVQSTMGKMSGAQEVNNQRIAPGQYEIESISKAEIEKRERDSRVDEVDQKYFKKAVDQ